MAIESNQHIVVTATNQQPNAVPRRSESNWARAWRRFRGNKLALTFGYVELIADRALSPTLTPTNRVCYIILKGQAQSTGSAPMNMVAMCSPALLMAGAYHSVWLRWVQLWDCWLAQLLAWYQRIMAAGQTLFSCALWM